MGPDLLALFVFVWGGVDAEANEDAAPAAVLPKNCFLLLPRAQKEPGASLGFVFP